MITRLLKGLLLVGVLSLSALLLPSLVHATVTPTPVTGNVQSILGANTTSNAFVRFRLRNFSGYVPRVNGIGVINIASVDVTPNSSGIVSTTLWGNDVILPGPNITYYTFEFWANGQLLASEDFQLACTPVAGSCTAGTFNFNTASPITQPPIPIPFFPVFLNPIGSQNIVEPPNSSLSLNGNPIVSLVGSATPGHCPQFGSTTGTLVDSGAAGCGGGGGGSGSVGYAFTQSTPASTWTITHNLNGIVIADCFDSTGQYFIPDSTIATSANVLTVVPPSDIQTGSCFVIGPGTGVTTTNILPLNNAWTGNETHAGSETFNGSSIFNGSFASNGSASFGGALTFTGSGNLGPITLGSGALGANNAWTGNETHNGTESFAAATVLGSLTSPKMNGFYYVDGVTYTTLKAAVTAAVTAGFGTIYDSMPETFTSNPFPGSGNSALIKIIFGPGLWYTNVPLTIGNAVITEGAGGGTVQGTTIQAVSGTFPTSTPMLTFANGGNGIFNSRISDMNLDCNNISGCSGIYSTELNEGSGGRDIGVWNFCTYGINIDASANSGGSPPNPAAHYFFEKVSALPSTTCSSSGSTIGIRLKGNAGDGPWTVRDVSVVGSSFLAGLWLDDMVNGSFQDLNIEGGVNGVLFGTAGISGITITNLQTFSGSPTNTINFNGEGEQITLYGLARGAATHILNDSLRGLTLNDTNIPMYVVGNGNVTLTTAYAPTPVGSLPSAGTYPGQTRYVNDSTGIASEGQTCAGGGSTVALAFSNGAVWKCF